MVLGVLGKLGQSISWHHHSKRRFCKSVNNRSEAAKRAQLVLSQNTGELVEKVVAERLDQEVLVEAVAFPASHWIECWKHFRIQLRRCWGRWNSCPICWWPRRRFW